MQVRFLHATFPVPIGAGQFGDDMTIDQKNLVQAERNVQSGVAQRKLARRLKHVYDLTLADVPLATIYNHIRRFDKRNAATKTAGLEAVTAPA